MVPIRLRKFRLCDLNLIRHLQSLFREDNLRRHCNNRGPPNPQRILLGLHRLTRCLYSYLARCGRRRRQISIKEKTLIFFAMTGSIFTALLYFCGHAITCNAALYFMIANVGSPPATFSNALLSKTPRRMWAASDSAVGYLGGGLLLALNLAIITRPDLFHIPTENHAGPHLHPIRSNLWSIFSTPLFLWVKEDKASHSPSRGRTKVWYGYRNPNHLHRISAACLPH